MMIAIGSCVAIGQSVSTGESSSATTTGAPVLLDSVIAVINGEVLLRSDLQSEMEMAALQPLTLPPGNGLERRAARRLVNRTLIVQQMQIQGMMKPVSDEDVQKDLDLLRKQLPDCAAAQCETDAGWQKFLTSHGLTSAEVTQRWRLRMEILAFIDERFRAGIRIAKPEMVDYYNKTLVPQFEKQNVKAPTLDAISGRIEEVLLQERVNVLLQEWLKTLRDQGNVIILDPALGKSNPAADSDDDDGGA